MSIKSTGNLSTPGSSVTDQSIIRGTSLLSSEELEKLGSLIVVTGPSGVGKGTVTGGALEQVTGLEKSVSVTTRPRREGEEDGVEYFFRSEEQFADMRKAGEFLEYAEFAGYHYGTPEFWVEQKIRSGTDVILEIEVQGAMQVRESCPEAVLVFLSPPSYEELENRLNKRATESKERIALRLDKAREEIMCRHLFDYEVINDNIEEAIGNLAHIVYAERLKIRSSEG